MRGRWRMALGALAAWVGVNLGAPAAAAQGFDPAGDPVVEVASWVMRTDDNHGLPFVIVDKVAAQVFVFGGDGRLRGVGAALLGMTRGDDSVPGVGERPLSEIGPDDRTTPAGRFVAGYGVGLKGEPVLWVDYDTAISLHAVVTSNPEEHRLERLESPTAEDNRISYGCINVSAAFYEDVVRKSFTGTTGVVYVLPEVRSLAEVFPTLVADVDPGWRERPGVPEPDDVAAVRADAAWGR